jgi:exosortase
LRIGRRHWASPPDRRDPLAQPATLAPADYSTHQRTQKTTAMSFAFDDSFGEERPLNDAESKVAWTVFGVLLGLLTLAYGDMLIYSASHWNKGLYSHGWIVPMIAGYLFWIRRKPLMAPTDADRWAGVGILVAALGVRVWASYYDYNNPDRYSFLIALLAVCLIVGGRSLLMWAGPALAFLIFMFPLPSFIERTMLMKLQTWASIMSTYTLQTLGVAAARAGNVISIDTLSDLTVAEACSGLRMLTIFFAMSVALVMIIDRPWWDRLIILLSAIPIALVSNVVRIVTTGLLFLLFGQDKPWLSQIIHDWAGFAMMPVGLGLLWLELTILSRLTIPADEGDYASFGTPALG